MLRVVGIEKSFGRKKVLRGINLEIEARSVMGLLGPNGAGKTTLMRIMVGFLATDRGRIIWQKKGGKIGYLSENNPLYPEMTAGEYLRYIGELKKIKLGEIEKVVKECGLGDSLREVIGKLSRGFKQRVGLAAALLGEPDVLILDEPTSGLDPKQIVEIRNLTKRLARKKTVILSTHILSEAKEVCDKVAIISRGKIVFEGKMSGVKNLEKKFIRLTE